jgi:peptidyl-prolyl cis-trans isomerase B (cyclophilin B)
MTPHVLLSLALALTSPVGGGPEVRWEAPGVLVAGQPYRAHISIVAPEGGTAVASWMLTPAAFTVDGRPLAKRDESGVITVPAGMRIEGDVELGPYIQARASFALNYASEIAGAEPLSVAFAEPAPAGLDFMTVPDEELAKYQVVLQTSRGDIHVKLWPQVAPNHVRNFLDLAYTKFYDGLTFHRVIPGFMIQGGDPMGTGAGDGKRPLKAEFDPNVRHVPGVLSMARRGTQGKRGPDDPLKDTASCQFFVMHGNAPALDGNYSAFGETLSGMYAVEHIVTAPRDTNDRPFETQSILRALVILAPAQ